MPAKWRPEESGTELTLVLWPKAIQGPCIRVLPPEKMDELMKEIEAMPRGDEKKGVLKRFIGRQSVQVTLDSAGRICIPEGMAKAAGIGNKAILVGLLDRFEIWSPERYAKVASADDALAPEAFKLMD